MPSLVSIAGIDEALVNLSLKPDSQKAKLIAAIRQSFAGQDDLQAVKEIPVDTLLAAIWEDADPTALKARRKSLSSLKSALNKSLKDLAAQGLNPEGIIISRANIFEVSDEQKSVLLEKLGGGGHLDSRLAEMFATFKKVFPEIAEGHGGEGMSDLLQALEQAKGLIAELDGALKEKDGQIAALQEKISALASGQDAGHSGQGGLGGPETSEEVAPHIAAEEVEEVVVDDSLDGGARGEDMLEIGAEDVEEVGVDDSLDDGARGEDMREISAEDVEEVEVDDNLDDGARGEDMQEISAEDVEEVEVDDNLDGGARGEDMLEISAEDVEEVEVDDNLDGGARGEDMLEISAEDVEEVEVDDNLDDGARGEDMQEISAEDVEEVEVDDSLDDGALGEDMQEISAEDVEEVEVDDNLDDGALGEDMQEISAEDVEEVEVGDNLDGGSRGEDMQEISAEDVEEVEVDDSLDAGARGEDMLEIDGEDVEEVEIDDNLDDGALGEDMQEISAEDVEEVEVDDSLDAGARGEDMLEIDGEDVEEVEIDDNLDDGEEFEEVEIDETGEISEILDEADQPGVPQSKLLEVLSKYLEPEEALQGRAETLTESEEGLVSQLLERFTPKFIKIPAGRYPFGCANPSPDEHPLQTVMVQEFFLGQYPVTNDLFELFVRETGYETDAEKFGHGLVCEGHWRASKDPATGRASFTITPMAAARQVNGANWRHPSGPGCLLEHRHNHPVVQISRRDAQAFAAWAGKRLPTEEEWEIAARGADGRLFPWGHEWHAENGNFSASCLGDTTPVERYQDRGRSPFGIADLLGNVYEWTASLPQPRSSGRIILKGGCWNSRGMISVCHRKIETETWSNLIGFRLAV